MVAYGEQMRGVDRKKRIENILVETILYYFGLFNSETVITY